MVNPPRIGLRLGAATSIIATLLVAAAIAFLGLPTSTARAEHPAGHRTFAAIDAYLRPSARTLKDHLASVELSDFGPYALVHEVGGQSYYAVLRKRHGHWRDLATISDEGLPCGLVPGKVIRDLKLERYNAGPHPCK